MELQCDGTRDNSYAARTSTSRIPLTCMILPSRAEYMRAKRPCQGAAITRSTSITHRIDTEFEHFRQLGEMLREGVGVPAVATLDHHSILEELAAGAQVVGKVRDREAVLTDHATQIVFRHHRTTLEHQRVVRIKLGRKAQLDEPKCRKDRNRGGGAERRGEIEADPEQNADGRRDPVSPSLKITPAPRKPIPVMMPCAMRVGSVRMASSGTTVIHWFWSTVTSISSDEATHTSACVRNPAGRP